MSIFDHSRSKFATALIQSRKNAGLTGKDVAESLGKASHATVSMWESDRSLPPLDDFIELCKLYNTTPNDLLGFDEEKK